MQQKLTTNILTLKKIKEHKVCPRINSPPNTFFSPKIRVFGVWRWFWAFWIAMGIGSHVHLTEIKNVNFLIFPSSKTSAH